MKCRRPVTVDKQENMQFDKKKSKNKFQTPKSILQAYLQRRNEFYARRNSQIQKKREIISLPG